MATKAREATARGDAVSDKKSEDALTELQHPVKGAWSPTGELQRLLTLLALWPNAVGRAEFKTELHLKREIEEMYEKIYG